MGTLGGIPLDAGDVLAKKYRLERLVGEGGTGVVVAARHLQLDQPVAIKFLRSALASEDVRLRFEREARAIAKIESDHVVVVFDVGALEPEQGGEPFMVMEFLEGRDLARALKEDGRLPVEDAVDCMVQVCDALAAAHATGIVHRDLKPANLFLTRRDGGPHVKVVDFGISKILDKQILERDKGPHDVTGAFEVLGSPRYMAPEQVRNSKEVDFRADLWSVGAVLFQLVTGRHAFEAESNMAASLAVLTSAPESLSKLAPHAPPGLEAVVNRCLAKDVTERFQSAKELAAALLPFASERAREAFARRDDAGVATNLSIALELESLARPTEIRGDVLAYAPPGAQPHSPTAPTERKIRISGAPSGGGAASPSASRGAAPSSSSSSAASFGAEPPSVDGMVASSARRAFRRSPARALKMAIAAGGLVAVLLAFGALTAAKALARSLGIGLGADEAAPAAEVAPGAAAALPPDLAAADPPSEVVTAPPPPAASQVDARSVLLDASRSPP